MPSYFELCIKVNTVTHAHKCMCNHTHTHFPWTANHCIWKAVITEKCE